MATLDRPAAQPMRVLCDESGNNDGQGLLIVGALATSKAFDTLEEQVRTAFEDFASRRDLRGMASFEHFRAIGFHAAEDPREIQQAFFDEISGWLGFKTFLIATDRSRFDERTETDQLLALYQRLLTDVIVRFRHHERIEFLIEDNEQIRPYLSELTHSLPERVRRRSPNTETPSLSATMVAKRNPHSLGVLDYVMAACARWMKAGSPVDPQAWTYRQFIAVQPSISMLYSIEHGLISSRGHRIG